MRFCRFYVFICNFHEFPPLVKSSKTLESGGMQIEYTNKVGFVKAIFPILANLCPLALVKTWLNRCP